MPLSERTSVWDKCGYTDKRDHVGALNVYSNAGCDASACRVDHFPLVGFET